MHHKIHKTYPNRTAEEIYAKVDQMMHDIAEKMSLHYERDTGARTGRIHKLGVTGSYAVREGEVDVDIKFPIIVPGTTRKKIEEKIHTQLDALFA